MKKNVSAKSKFTSIPELLTASEAANALRIHRSQVTRFVKNGRLSAIRVGARLMIEKGEILRFLEANQI